MKKRLFLALLALSIFIFGATYAFAQNIPDDTPTPGFVDADSDGVCDYQGSGMAAHSRQHSHNNSLQTGFIDEDGDGVCDHQNNMEYGLGSQQNHFVDADGDGVCDNTGTAVKNQGRQHGRGQQRMSQP